MGALPKITLILNDIRSSENVGAIFRTADAAGVSKIYLAGYTPAPIDRFGRKNTKLTKASLGAEEFVSWESVKIEDVIQKLKGEGVTVVAVEQAENSVPYDSWKATQKVALIFGNEVDGVPKELLEKCDAVLEIPMHGKKESLNVSVSAGIVLFGLRKS